MNSPDNFSAAFWMFGRFLRIAIFLFISFLFIRTIVIEPVGVPTGSMSPLFLGNHRQVYCSRCDYPVVVGEVPGEKRRPFGNPYCENCNKRADLVNSIDLPGDRLLVDKFVYHLRKPKRWEAAVFKCPVDDTQAYVKRVVGLPNDLIQIIDGDIFVNGEIQRKDWVYQQQMLLPVFDSEAEPADLGWAKRFLWNGQSSTEKEWANSVLSLKSPNEKSHLKYLHYDQENERTIALTDLTAYNGGVGVGRIESVHDFVLTFEIEKINLNNTGIFQCRISDGNEIVELEIQTTKPIKISSQYSKLETTTDITLPVNQKTKITFGFVDRRVVFFINNDDTKIFTLDIPTDHTTHNQRLGIESPFEFSVEKGHFQIEKLKLFRDVHYRQNGLNAVDVPYQLKDHEYFMLGDNSANSKDSRVWKIPVVKEWEFIGKPLFIHQPTKLGRVKLNQQDKTYRTLDWDRFKRIK